jgi:glucose-6-phosphate-specific signal transduction histidine kinase
LVWLAFGAAGEGARQAARMAMFLPVIFLAMRYGWHGAAVGGTASSIAVVLTMSPQHDLETLQSEIFISFAITAMMLFGARIAHLNAREQKDREGLQVALALAQRNVYLGEMQLQQTSQALERVRESVRSTFSLFLERMRVAAPLFDERTMRRRVVVAQEQLYRLSDTLYPLVWRDHGLPTALREGAIARSLSECGMVYWCDVQRSEELKKLPQVMHITLYRLACEAIGLACAKDGSSSIRLTLRGGSFGPRRWAVLRVDRGCEPHRGENVQREELLMRLPFHGLGVDAMRDRAGAFKGKLRIRKRPAGDRLSIILHEPEGSRQ